MSDRTWSKRRVHASIEFIPWTLWLAFHVDPDVIRSGDDGIEHGWDIDIGVLCWQVEVSIYRVANYVSGESALDAIVAVEAWVNQPALRGGTDA